MKKRFSVTLLALTVTLLGCAGAMALTGSWRGKLSFGGMSLPLVFNFTESAAGATGCTMDSPAQGATGIPVSVTLCTADSVALECRAIGASYNGKIVEGTITGTFRQSGMTFPLILKPDAPLEERRPQTPRPPFPYRVVDTTFTAPDGAVLSGTLSLPAAAKGKKVPAVVLVSGSGPQNRDEELFEHKPFAVIADYLARNGIASLRYDDRGTGKSTGDFGAATTYTFKDDAKSAIDFMRTIPDIGKVGVIGHSEGGTIAFMLGAEKATDFIISLAGMAVPGKETIIAQNVRSLEKTTMSAKDKENTIAILNRLFDTMADQARRGQSSPIDIDSLVKTSGLQVPPAILSSLKAAQKTRTPWLDTILTIDPAESLARIKCPLLAINGDKDTQVDAHTNLAAIKKHCPQARIHLLPSLNHLLQPAHTGDVTEYPQIPQTISPTALSLLPPFITP